MQHNYNLRKSLLLGLASKLKSSKKPPIQKKPKKVKTEDPPKKRRGRPPKTEKVMPKQRKPRKTKAPAKKEKPVVVKTVEKTDTKERRYCKIVFDLDWLKMYCEDKQFSTFAKKCLSLRTYEGGYTKPLYDFLQQLLDRFFGNSIISVKAFPLAVSIGDHVIREVYGREDYFHVEVTFEKGAIKIPQGGTTLQKDTVFFNEINSLVPKDIRRTTGFISL